MPSRWPTLTPELVDNHLRERCFASASRRRVGVEVEWLTVPLDRPTQRPDLDELRATATAAADTCAVSFEPGGQLELSSPPCDDAAAAAAAVAADLGRIRPALAERAVALVGLGLDPSRAPVRVNPAPRYEAMERYFDLDGTAGRTMMCNTAAIQVNVDTDRWHLAHALGPVLAAAFANSPLRDGRPSGWRSSRLAVWAELDSTRSGPVDRGGAPAHDWATYARAARVMLVRSLASGGFLPVLTPLSFECWMERGHELGYPDLDDLEYHLTTLFPPVRPRGWLELRMVDALPDPWWQVPVAVVATLLQDGDAAAVAEHACAGLHLSQPALARDGLADPVLRAAARTCFAAATDALSGSSAELVAAYAERYVARGRCPADDVLDAWHADPDAPWPREDEGCLT